jgi:hypothetical protein
MFPYVCPGGVQQRHPRPQEHVTVDEQEPLGGQVGVRLGLVPVGLQRVKVLDGLPLAHLADEPGVGEPGLDRPVVAAEIGSRVAGADEPAAVLDVQMVERHVVDLRRVDAEQAEVVEHGGVTG